MGITGEVMEKVYHEVESLTFQFFNHETIQQVYVYIQMRSCHLGSTAWETVQRGLVNS